MTQVRDIREKNIKSSATNVRIKSFYSQMMIQLFSDILAIAVSMLILYLLRFESGVFQSEIKPGLVEVSLGLLFFEIYWLTLFFFSGLYKNWYEKSPFDEIWNVFKAALLGSAIIAFVIYSDTHGLPRKLFLFYFFVFSALILLGRIIARNFERTLRIKGILKIPAIIVGTEEKALNFYRMTKTSPAWGYSIQTIFLLDKHERFDNDEIQVSYQALDQLGPNLDNFKPEEVIISTSSVNHDILLEIVEMCADRKIRVRIEPDLYDIFTGRTRTQNLYGIPLIEISTRIMKPWQEVAKRLFDIAFGSLVLLIGMPLWILIGIILYIDSPGPIIYKQVRCGRDGKPFWMYKFRSMHVNADQFKGWTSVNDPRVTRFGRILRKSHLDEIPQFFNVLIGDMSVVGPRPEQPKYVDQFSKSLPHYKRRLVVRPGITGWWQVKYQPHELDDEEVKGRLVDDFYYIENMSLGLDIEIVVRTVWCVFSGHGQA